MSDPYQGIEGIRQSGQPQPGDVHIVFHAYSGFLVYVVQRRHDVVLPASQAKILLKRLFKHNMTWGFFVYGAIFVPILTLFEYRSQMKKVAKALQQGFPVIPK